MNAAFFASVFTIGEVVIIILLVGIIVGQYRLRRGIIRIEDK